MKWRLSCCGSSIVVDSPHNLQEAAASLASSGLPLWYSIDDECVDRPPSVVHSPGPDSVDVSSGALTFCSNSLAAGDLLHLAYLQLEAALQDSGLVTFHAAAARSPNGRATLLLGPTGAGKTSVALRLCQRHGYTLIGNDIVIVGSHDSELRAFAGSTYVMLRRRSHADTFPGIVDATRASLTPDVDPWREKWSMNARDVGIDLGINPSPISSVTIVHVDQTYSRLFHEDKIQLADRLSLFENASRYIRGTATPWLTASREFGPSIPSLDTAKRGNMRRQLLNRLLVQAQYISGNLEMVTDAVAATTNGNGA